MCWWGEWCGGFWSFCEVDSDDLWDDFAGFFDVGCVSDSYVFSYEFGEVVEGGSCDG